MAYSLEPATIWDTPELAEVYHEAFKNDHILGYFYPDGPRDVIQEKDVKYFDNAIDNAHLYGGRMTKVVENSTNKSVGFAEWNYPCHLSPEQKLEREKKDEEANKNLHIPGAQDALIDEFFNQIAASRKKWVDPEKTFLIHFLAVHPDHQGKGLGGMLLREGLADADRAGAQTYIEASPAGLPVYLKYGWKIVDGMDIDMRPYGGTKVEHQPFLMREPKPYVDVQEEREVDIQEESEVDDQEEPEVYIQD